MLTKAISSNTEWVKSSHSLNTEREKAIYNMGKEHGAEEVMEKYEQLIAENLTKSYNDTTKILEKLKQDDISVISARLKLESINCFKIMLSIKDVEDSVLNLDDVYNFIYQVEESSNTADYMIDFSIIKANSKFSDSKVESDGYIYKHRLSINEEESRPA